MAVAEQIKRIEIKLVEQEIIHEDVILTLSKDEAQFLFNYLGHTVTGSKDSLRVHADAVYKALLSAGLDYTWGFPKHIEGGVHHNHFRVIKEVTNHGKQTESMACSMQEEHCGR